MGMEALTIAAIAMSAVGAVMSSSAAADQASMQAEMAHQQAQAQVNELAQQQADVNAKANEEKSDRIRQAERELASARVASAEGFSMTNRLVGEIGYNEGLDLSRIESSRVNSTEAITSRMKAASAGAVNTAKLANAQASAASNSAFIGAIGSGMSIAGAGYDRAVKTAAANGTTAPTMNQYIFGK